MAHYSEVVRQVLEDKLTDLRKSVDIVSVLICRIEANLEREKQAHANYLGKIAALEAFLTEPQP